MDQTHQIFEEINHKMDLVLEGYGEMGRKFEEARIEREQIKNELITPEP